MLIAPWLRCFARTAYLLALMVPLYLVLGMTPQLQLAVVDRVVTYPKAPHYPKPYAILNAWQRRERKDFIRKAVLLGVYRRVLCVRKPPRVV